MRTFFNKTWNFIWKAILAFFIVSILSVMLFRFVPVPITPLMVVRNVEALFGGKKLSLKKNWVSIGNISNNLQLAVMCSEDQNFTAHHGFDFKAIDKAIKHNKNHKQKRGASTISQQTAKNLFLWTGRSWLRKGFEVYFTGLIEFFWNKKRIMEVYLNIIETGNGIYGAEAASKYYFKKSAKNLSKGEAALIAAILPNPRKYSAIRPTPFVQRRQSWVVRQMGYYGNSMYYDRPMNNEKGQNAEDEPVAEP